MLRTLALFALVAAIAATNTRQEDYQKTRKRCKTTLDRAQKAFERGDAADPPAECLSFTEFQSVFCEDLSDDGCYVARKVSSQFYNGDCCDEYECVLKEDDPCCGVTCEAESLEDADMMCNIIHPNNQVWNNMSPHNGAMYAELVTRADPLRGKCCDKYKCRTDFTQLCEAEKEITPCVDVATCPACHTAEISSPADAAAGKCCPDIVCVENPECMCNEREGWKTDDCPVPECDSDFEFLVILAEATAGSCCPVYTCQRDLAAVCEEKLANYEWVDWFGTGETGFVDGEDGTAAEICGPCQTVTKYRASNPAAGRCFPTWKCKPTEDKCCESDYFHGTAGEPADEGEFPNTGEKDLAGEYVTCEDIKTEKATCSDECEEAELTRPANRNKGRCCDTWVCAINPQCVCDSKVCAFADADAFQALYCPNKEGPSTKKFFKVETIEANPAIGKCCPSYVCRETAAKRVRDIRVNKRKAKRAARRARKSSTTRR